MTLDAYETKDEIVFTAVVPGVKPKDIEVTVARGVLTIKGEIKTEEEVEERDYIRRERRYGKFCRTMTLPKEVNTDKAQAEFEDGILKLTLPKAEAAKIQWCIKESRISRGGKRHVSGTLGTIQRLDGVSRSNGSFVRG
jgi:HSP20 family protein